MAAQTDADFAAQILALAPAAGSGIGKQLAERLLGTPDFVKSLAGAMEASLHATRSFWVSTGKGEGYLKEEPDWRTRLQGAALIMAHMEGEPVKRIIHQHLGAGKIDLGGALADSPELQAAMERELQKAKWKHSGNQAHKRPKRAVLAVETEV